MMWVCVCAGSGVEEASEGHQGDAAEGGPAAQEDDQDRGRLHHWTCCQETQVWQGLVIC